MAQRKQVTAIKNHGVTEDKKRRQLVDRLTKAYWAEIETIVNYMANSINPDGVRARQIVEVLEADIKDELGHAKEFGNRIKELYGVVPGSKSFVATQPYLQPPEHQTDIVHVIRGVIAAEEDAIEMYGDIVEFCDDVDLVTQDMVLTILRDEQRHLRLFQGFLREYESDGLA